MRQRQLVALGAVSRHHQPTGEALLGVVKTVADRGLRYLGDHLVGVMEQALVEMAVDTYTLSMAARCLSRYLDWCKAAGRDY